MLVAAGFAGAAGLCERELPLGFEEIRADLRRSTAMALDLPAYLTPVSNPAQPRPVTAIGVCRK